MELLFQGRGDRTRTCDSLVPNQERYQLRYTSDLRVQRYTFFVTLANFSAIISCYLIIPCSTKIFLRATTERSTCSWVWVAMRA